MRRKVLLHSWPNIGQGTRIFFADEFRCRLRQIECFFDAVGFRVCQQCVQGRRVSRLRSERIPKRDNTARGSNSSMLPKHVNSQRITKHCRIVIRRSVPHRPLFVSGIK